MELEGLMHDAHEAVTGDISSPMKAAIVEMIYRITGEHGVDPVKAIADMVDRAIAKQFGLLYPRPAAVKAADLEAMTLERRQMMLPASGIAWTTDVRAREFALQWMDPDAAANAFVSRFNYLLHRRPEVVS